MGTDAGTDTSEKAPIGGRTSLTQLDTWLEAMDGETLCLTGKVTDCWQPVDGTQENASFLLKDLSIEADASSFVFSGDSAETTDNLSQISGSADADQMSVLISSQKTTSQINEMQEIFGKNARALCYLEKDTTLPKAGSYVRVFGEVSPFLQATNPGEFDAAAYYRRKDCLFALRKTKITAQTKNYGRLEEFLSQLRYESEVLFRKLLGEKNGATASAMVLGRKKGMDSEVKALYQGAGISHLLAISGLHLSLIGAGLFGLLKKVRLPVAAMKIANAIRETASTHIRNVMDIEAVNIVETANVPTHKASPSAGKNTVLGGMLGILIVAAIVILSHLMNDTIQTEEDVEKYLGISTLAMIPLNDADGKKKKKKYKKQATSGK